MDSEYHTQFVRQSEVVALQVEEKESGCAVGYVIGSDTEVGRKFSTVSEATKFVELVQSEIYGEGGVFLDIDLFAEMACDEGGEEADHE